ncbi:histone H1-like [Phymastichus coffea]|uniref:histone H1-like n=1 Tax=Phymastichus coffea TaxID=108790 RepID=UPI00273A93FD|nr:histone H1-like [Phymastichus coffea]
MTETAATLAPTAEAPAAQASPKKTKTSKKVGVAKKLATKPNHPPTGEMVNAAIIALKDKKGSSLQAIKKYIAGNYKVNVDKQSIFIKKYIKSAVTKKTIVQTKGTGAAGRFKIAAKSEGEKIAKKPVATKKPVAAKKPVVPKKAKAVAKPKDDAVKKPTAAQKPAAAKKQTAAKKAPAKPKVAKPVKAKTTKTPTKPKAPKPKKAAAPKAKAAPKK